jgi:hypothetical protein
LLIPLIADVEIEFEESVIVPDTVRPPFNVCNAVQVLAVDNEIPPEPAGP